MSLAGYQINPIDVNFPLQKVWKVWTLIQLTKSNPKSTKAEMPLGFQIRVGKQ
jgi:hypothetical protein